MIISVKQTYIGKICLFVMNKKLYRYAKYRRIEVHVALKDNIDEKILGNVQNFFKEKIMYYGVKVQPIAK